jgi:hypothetical protein
MMIRLEGSGIFQPLLSQKLQLAYRPRIAFIERLMKPRVGPRPDEMHSPAAECLQRYPQWSIGAFHAENCHWSDQIISSRGSIAR